MFPKKIPNETYVDLARFLLKWKAATTRALIDRFFPMVEPITGYQYLLKCERRGWISRRCDNSGTHWAWTLTKQSLKWLFKNWMELREMGYASEHFLHDLIVSAVHLGDWLNGKPEGTSTFSEQQLRRNYPEHYKPWVPDTQIRRPDGYWKLNQPGPKNVVALEVELSLKTKSEYGCIGMFYRDREEIQRVVWLARGIRSANTILRGIRSNNYTDPNQHVFITLPDFFKLGWQAPVRLGPELGKTLSEILHGNIVQNSPQFPCTMSLLDTRKSATPKRRCTLDEKFRYCR